MKPSNSIPSVFCWSKMGAEAGQDLSSILRRKELERQSGEGSFSWGIGNSVAPAVAYARNLAGSGEVDALFTPMKSAAKEIDVSPAQLAIWLTCTSAGDELIPLPRHMLVTSRLHQPSGAEKRSHYALICRADTSLTGPGQLLCLDSVGARNLVTDRPVGASQVTAVVKYKPPTKMSAHPYKVLFRAKLEDTGFVRLRVAVPLVGQLLTLYKRLCDASTVIEWIDRIDELKYAANRNLSYRKQPSIPAQTPLFAD